MGFESLESKSPEYSNLEQEEAMARVTEKLGRVLAQIWEGVSEGEAQADLTKVKKELHIVFRPVSEARTRVWVDAFDHAPQVRDTGTHLRSFRLRLIRPEAFPRWEWIVNESVRGEATSYTAALFDYESRRDSPPASGTAGQQNFHGLQDPTLAVMEQAGQIVDECWNLYNSGDTDSIFYWGGKEV
jgi:hypothetical protein